MSEIHTPQLLFIRISEGDQQALGSLFNLFYNRLIYFVTGYVKSRESAEEVVSDVFVNLWQQKDKLCEVQNPETYLFVCARNGALNYIRRFGNTRVVFIEETGCSILTENTDPSRELEKKELMLKMEQAIEALPLQCKTIFRLVKEQGFKCREVAEIMNLSTRTVETQVYKAVKKLDEALNTYQAADKKTSSKTSLFSFLFSFLFF